MANCSTTTGDAVKNLGGDEASKGIDIRPWKVTPLFESVISSVSDFVLTGLFLSLLELYPLYPQLANNTPHCASLEVFALRVRDNG